MQTSSINKKHYYEIDFIRAICSIGIIIFHYSCESSSSFKFLHFYANGDWGNLLVTIFFIVSGFSLYLSNSKIDSLKKFYYKRAKSIYPSFWICWFIFYTINVYKVKNFFYAGSPIRFLLTLIGEDGYSLLRITNYYTVGEWFLGALIIVYLLYPLLLIGINKNDKFTLALLCLLTYVIVRFDIPTIAIDKPGIIESCLKVFIGMYICKYKDKILNNKIIFILTLVIFLILLNKNITLFVYLIRIIISVCGFIVLFNIGSIITKNEIIKTIFSKLGNISYQTFLFQHQIINYVLLVFDPNAYIGSILACLICIFIILACAKLLNLFVNTLLNLKVYKRFEEKILN